MTDWPAGSLAPQPGAASRRAMLAAQSRVELTLLLRNGEQVLLTLLIPVGLLLVLTLLPVVRVPAPRVAFVVPGVLALAVMSTAFTGQAIAVGFDRQYGVLQRLGTTALPRGVLLAAKAVAVLAVEALQVAVVGGLGLLLGWRPGGSLLAGLVLLLLATVAFSGLGFLLGGTLPGLSALAAANLVWFVLLVLGGVLFPVTQFGAAAPVLALLPTAALADGLRTALGPGGAPARDLIALAVWAVAAPAVASRLFRWR